MDKRHFPRVAINSLTVDGSDGVGFFLGQVSDVSRFGLCLTDVPKKVDVKAGKMMAIVNGPEMHFKMIVIPKWSAATGSLNKSVGVEIVDPPRDWIDFVMGFEPEDDSWGATS